MKKILIIFGTRPEAIKMAPLIATLKNSKVFEIAVCVTSQHKEMLRQVLDLFMINVDYDLHVMRENQTLEDLTSKILVNVSEVIQNFKPNLILVHGDTATTMASSLAAFYKKTPLGHIEAGLRTGNLYSPWPEEANRKITDMLSKFFFVPTAESKKNLLLENIKDKNIYVTGNTVIDALVLTKKILDTDEKRYDQCKNQFDYLRDGRKLILITGHRRESFGEGFVNICNAIKILANKYEELDFVYPVHLNPNVQKPVNKILADLTNVHLIEPLEYLPFVYLMDKAHIILTDSGGIQEEAPTFGKPVLVMRDTTERQEAVDAGTVKLVGTSEQSIILNVEKLLNDDDFYSSMSNSKNPYGDGSASTQILRALMESNEF